jgi:hypothetical protein
MQFRLKQTLVIDYEQSFSHEICKGIQINEPNFLPLFYKKYQENMRKLERPYQYQIISQLETLIIDECGLLMAAVWRIST